MPLSIDHFKTAVTQYPDAEALISLPQKRGITKAKEPRMSLLSFLGLGSYSDEIEKSRAIVNDFKAALVKKYGKEISCFVFPSHLEGDAATSSLKSRTVQIVLQKAEILDLLKQAIIDTITNEHAEPEPEDSPFQNVPGKAQSIFPKATIDSIKEAYYDHVEATANWVILGRIRPLSPSSSARLAQQLVQEDLQRAGLGQHSHFVPITFLFKALEAARKANNEVDEIIFAPLRLPVPTQAAYTAIPAVETEILAASNSASPIAQAIPLNAPQHAVRVDDSEWNI